MSKIVLGCFFVISWLIIVAFAALIISLVLFGCKIQHEPQSWYKPQQRQIQIDKKADPNVGSIHGLYIKREE